MTTSSDLTRGIPQAPLHRNPFAIAAAVYLLLDALAFAGMALVNGGLLAPISGLTWLHVHLLTIGVVTQTLLGALPTLAVARTGAAPGGPGARWAVWMLVNVSLALLLVGMPAGWSHLAATGAIGVFAAVLLTLVSVHRGGACPPTGRRAAMRFFIAGPVFFLVGITMALSMLLGWPAPGGYFGLLEAHVHANVWGFLALVAAGVLMQEVPARAGRPLALPRASGWVSWLLIAGALGLVFGPWLAAMPLTIGGLAVYTMGTALLLASLVGTLAGWSRWTPALAHVLTAYIWMLVPVIVAPAVLAATGALPSGAVEAAAVAGLVAGWVLQVALGGLLWRTGAAGSWASVLLINLGVLAIWWAAAAPAAAAQLTTAGYVLVIAGFAPGLWILVPRLAGRRLDLRGQPLAA